MIENTVQSSNKLLWDDEVDDEAMDNLVRLIQEGHVFKKIMFGGSLTAAELGSLRAEKKTKRKKEKAKEKKDRESQADAFEMESGDVGDPNHIANLVAWGSST